MATSKAQAQLADDLMQIYVTTPVGELRPKILALLAERGVQCLEIKTWSQDELDRVPTGHPIAPTGATPADRVLDRAGVSDPQAELDYIKGRVAELQDKMAARAERERKVVPVTKSEPDETRDAMRRIGMDPDDYEPY